MTVPLRVLYCHCAYAQVVPKEVKAEVLRRLTESDLPFDAVPDLCELSAKRDPALAELVTGPATIVACYPRAVKWLFAGAGCPLPEDGVRVLNMRTDTADAVMAGVYGEPTAGENAEEE